MDKFRKRRVRRSADILNPERNKGSKEVQNREGDSYQKNPKNLKSSLNNASKHTEQELFNLLRIISI